MSGRIQRCLWVSLPSSSPSAISPRPSLFFLNFFHVVELFRTALRRYSHQARLEELGARDIHKSLFATSTDNLTKRQHVVSLV